MKMVIFFLAVLTLISCQTSRITYTWTEKNMAPKKFHKVLVLAVLPESDHELQMKMEKHLSGDLKEIGYAAYSAAELFPAGTFVKGDTARAMAAIDSKGFDAVLTIVLLDKVKEKCYVPGRVVYTPYAPYYNRFDNYYYTIYHRIYTEGYYTTGTRIFWETNFYDVNEKKLIYSSQTRSFDPGSRETLAHYYGVLIANSLVKSKVLIKPEEPMY
jgi:hypothetical protein